MKLAVPPWRSLDQKLPLLIAAVLLATVAAFSASAYHLVQEVLLTAAGERLQGASAPIVLALSQSARRQAELYATVARDPAIAHFLLTGRDREEARRALARGWGPTQSSRGLIELRNAQGEVVLDTSFAAAPAGTSWADGVIRAGGVRAGETIIAPLLAEGDTVFGGSLVGVPAPDSGNRTRRTGKRPVVLGYILDTRPVVGQGVKSIRELLGREAAFFVGSPETGVWTDLEHTAAPPPAALEAGSALVYDSSARGPGVGAAATIAGTPWLLWVEQPRAAVLAPMNDLVEGLALLALLFILGGTLGAWAFSRRITQPIVALADAADRVAPVAEPRAADPISGDEVARLTGAFARMSARVEVSREELEGLVAERTARLESALHELEIAQQELVKKERLAILGQLSSAVGHELRNPLGVMTNAMYVIERCLPEGQPPIVREYLDLVRGQIAASERIVGDLLDTARIRAPETAAVDLRELVDAQLRRLGPTTEVAIERRFADDLPAVRMDPIQLSQILLNLMSNAVQAMGDGGGALTIAAAADEEGQRVQLSITDTGPGMPPEVLDRIFEPLFTTKARGLGLGLWVSQNLATTNGSTLTAATRPGQGSTFTLDMPTVLVATTTVA